MEWNDPPKSVIFDLVRTGKLLHPTNDKFDPADWMREFASLAAPTDRDRELVTAAVHYGRERSRMRRDRMTTGLGRKQLVTLFAAFANRQFLAAVELQNNAIKKHVKTNKYNSVDINSIAQIQLSNAIGQQMTAAQMYEALDSNLPNWLFHIWKVSDETPIDETIDTLALAQLSMQISNVEYNLRQLWHASLWYGDKLIERGNTLVAARGDRALAERWCVWEERQRMIFDVPQDMDAGQSIAWGGKPPPVRPMLHRTVIRMERPRGGGRRFIVGHALGTKLAQRRHVNENALLANVYIGLFLDEPLPRSCDGTLTCRELLRAWWVLQDLADVAIIDLQKSPSESRWETWLALSIEHHDLVSIFRQALAVSEDRANELIEWMTCDPDDEDRLFLRGLVSTPLVPEPGSQRKHVVLSPLMTNSPVKRVEAWMEKGGISDNRGIKGIGKPFERHVRQTLNDALSRNPLLPDAEVYPNGLKRKGNSEEIDLLIRLGKTIIVGEIKCFTIPDGILGRFNHLKRISKATRQCADKLRWAEKNRDKMALAFGISDASVAESLKFVPIVLSNHQIGLGLQRNGITVIDLNYLLLLMNDSKYKSKAIHMKNAGTIYEETNLYRSQEDLENIIVDIFCSPIVLKPFENTVYWREIWFPESSGREFLIEVPTFGKHYD